MLNPIENSAINSIAENAEKIKSFETVKRIFETAYTSGADYSAPLYDLATAVAYSVIGKCIDPQRKTAPQRDTVSTKGYNPAMIELRQGIAADTALLKNTHYAAEHATRITYNADGDKVTEIEDNNAESALTSLVSETFTDGIDLVHTAALALLEQAKDHANGENWLDIPYTVRRLNKKVWIKTPDSAAYNDTDTTPIQEVFRAVRQQIMSSRAVQTDPRNGYTYIEELTEDGLDTIYLRMGKYVDIGGYDCNGNYTAGEYTAKTYESILEKLNLTARQATIIHLRMQGYGYKAIGTYLGVTHSAIFSQLKRIAERAAAIGFIPDGYKVKQKPQREQTGQPMPIIAVIQMDIDGNEIARYSTLKEARTATGTCEKSMYNAVRGYQKTAGGYRWRIEYIED